MDEDQAALERILNGDEQGLAQLMERHKDALFRFAVRYTGNAADAAEIAEATFHRVYVNAAKFRPRGSVRSWIFTIAANLCRDHYRRQRKHRNTFSMHATLPGAESGNPSENFADAQSDPSREARTRESLEQINAAVMDLPHKLRFPFVFCVLEDQSYEACADVLNTSRKTVETRIYRARNFLRQKLADLRHDT